MPERGATARWKISIHYSDKSRSFMVLGEFSDARLFVCVVLINLRIHNSNSTFANVRMIAKMNFFWSSDGSSPLRLTLFRTVFIKECVFGCSYTFCKYSCTTSLHAIDVLKVQAPKKNAENWSPENLHSRLSESRNLQTCFSQIEISLRKSGRDLQPEPCFP